MRYFLQVCLFVLSFYTLPYEITVQPPIIYYVY